jgi:hypothetical protein
VPFGPPAGGAAARLFLRRIDPSSEERFERRVDARAAERSLDERIEAERRQVAFVENDRMPEIDRARVVRLVGQEVEERTGTCPVA